MEMTLEEFKRAQKRDLKAIKEVGQGASREALIHDVRQRLLSAKIIDKNGKLDARYQ